VNPGTTAQLLKTLLRDAEWPHSASECEHQEYLDGWLTEHGIGHEREVVLGEHDRIDFLAGDVGIELKVSSGSSAIVRQLQRYAQSSLVSELLLLSLRRSPLTLLPQKLSGKPVVGLHIGRSM
jgi:hypothetical protein